MSLEPWSDCQFFDRGLDWLSMQSIVLLPLLFVFLFYVHFEEIPSAERFGWTADDRFVTLLFHSQ